MTVVTQAKEAMTGKEVIEEDRVGVTETLKEAIGADWCELEETVKTSIARAVQDRFKPVLIKKNDAKTVARTKRCGRSMSGSWIRYRMKSERRAFKRERKQFNSTLGYPGEGPPRVKDFGDSVKCSECDIVPWRVSRNGDAGKVRKMQKREEKRN